MATSCEPPSVLVTRLARGATLCLRFNLLASFSRSLFYVRLPRRTSPHHDQAIQYEGKLRNCRCAATIHNPGNLNIRSLLNNSEAVGIAESLYSRRCA